jgi:hypothetical protein
LRGLWQIASIAPLIFLFPLRLLPPSKGDFDYNLLPVAVKRKNEVFYRLLAAIAAPKPSSKSVAGSVFKWLYVCTKWRKMPK